VRHGSQIARPKAVNHPTCGRAKRRKTWWVGDRHATGNHHPLEEGIEKDDHEATFR